MEGKLKSINCTKLPTLPFISVSEVMSCFNHSELEIQKLPRYQVNFYPTFRLLELTFAVMVTIYIYFIQLNNISIFQGIKKENVVMFDKKMLGYVHCSRNLNMFVHLLRKNIENKTNMTRDFYLEFEQYLS